MPSEIDRKPFEVSKVMYFAVSKQLDLKMFD